MDINEILKTRLEQNIKAFSEFSGGKMEETARTIRETTAEIRSLRAEIKAIKIPEEISVRHDHQHQHVNAGVRFMLIALVAVIIVASITSFYYYGMYSKLKGFTADYDLYQKNNRWGIGFYDQMRKAHPKEVKDYIDGHPLPK